MADFCNGSMVVFNEMYSFVPNSDVVIACSLAEGTVVWSSSFFANDVSISAIEEVPVTTRLNGSIVFQRTNYNHAFPPCLTVTATFENIQESVQGIDLTCADGLFKVRPNLTIDVIGKNDFFSDQHVLLMCFVE